MTDREKLIDLLYDSNVMCDQGIEDLADEIMDLLSHGVTVREPQKPLTVEELFEIAHKDEECDRTVWIEDATGWADGVILHVCSILYDSDEEAFIHYMLGDSNDFCTDSAYYNKTWRCWAEKPTEEERENALWEN